jgi:glycine dehydrogenase subunit 2
VPAREDGTVDPASVKALLSPDVAAIMLTNPNTCGLFERDIVEIAEAVHAAGAYLLRRRRELQRHRRQGAAG